MHPRLAGATALGALLVLATGCGTLGNGTAGRAAPALQARAAAATVKAAGTIDVHGTGLVQGTPDLLEVNVGVSTTADSAKDALERANQESGQVITTLKTAGVAVADIQTRNFSIFPSFDDKRKRFTYSVANTVNAKLRDLLKAGAILDDVASSAGNDIRIEGVSFSFADNSSLLAAARTDAVRQARRQAEQLARGAGVKLGPVKSMTEDSSGLPTVFATMQGLRADASASPVPIEPGSESLTVAVHVVYTIAK
ncbi:MAG: hypothetical protein JWL73_1277 [Actinomycetia bacterium]|nr:hypothetical protein [Actinomycetes bacterium]